jgi:transposase-like protein
MSDTIMQAMTPAQYAAAGGNCCPYCRSTQVEGGSIDVDGPRASQRVWCLDCDEEWTDTYVLTGYIGE